MSIPKAFGQTALKGVLEAQVDQLLDKFYSTVFHKEEFPHDVKFGNGVVSRSGAPCNRPPTHEEAQILDHFQAAIFKDISLRQLI